ncbi:M24 family metallopeptidase [Mesorhizobium sp. B2-3-4]|uniref:M24 family metallopeptidase n=1 Tax=Mesorhizobium sp. B2-3-4 TaxID=2589959 RepID=UPI00112A11FA|nr:M24 family metallopeptidase [Mesorhizobium sp. B2-3-4]TPM28297.1 aminopeptidase P family protein [Mesorhizobium sp. B2-3-4]
MEHATGRHDEAARTQALRGAERMALNLLDAIEEARFIQAGRTEREIELDIRALAKEKFGIERDWHKRIVRAGINTLSTAADNPPIRMVEHDDMVFLDLGPVLEEWEADVRRSYAVGDDPRKHALCDELPRQFEIVKRHFEENPDISGADLYAFACASAERSGWKFGGKIAGHIVAEFPHARIPGVKQLHHVSPENPDPMRNPDANGRVRHWILEIHLVSPDGAFGGFYERLLEGS